MEQKIKKLSGIEHIRHRSNMWIGDTTTPDVLAREIIDNAIDEFINGFADLVEIKYGKDDNGYYVQVLDTGRGLPVYEYEGEIAAKILFTELFAGGKFDSDSYEYKQGLHGVGLTAVNALSKRMIIEVIKDSKYWKWVTERGKIVEETVEDISSDSIIGEFSTKVTAYPDPEIFDSTKISVDLIPLQLATKLVRDSGRENAKIIVNDEEIKSFDFKDYLENEMKSKAWNDTVIEIESKIGSTIWKIWLTYDPDSFSESIHGSVNMLHVNQGIHIKNFRQALGIVLQKHGLDRAYIGVGLRAFVLVMAKEVGFSSQSKERLTKIGDIIDSEIITKLSRNISKEFPDEFIKYIEQKQLLYKEKLNKLKNIDAIKKNVITGKDKRSLGLGLNIYDCTIRKREDAELFIVEGQSAAGTLLQVRDRKYQAVLPLKGKPLNAANVQDLSVILNNKEMKSLVNSIGVGVTPMVDLSASRYGKIFILADKDDDGIHISAIILAAFIYLVPDLVEEGMLYIVDPPLYEQNGKLIWNEEELDKFKPFTRFKGLGEMNPDQIYKTALDPKTRFVRQVILDDYERVMKIIRSSLEKRKLLESIGILNNS